ncbi:MAG TPA: SEC-C metal-binding domain-containing protein [Candidatus Tumulicola sp.]|nr:SEC-C metal-binding domain-containing protein [Candidatus Tumulicola sp.]
MQKVGRNDPCPCGSGRKHKRCCLGREAQRDAFARSLEARALPLLQEIARYAERVAGMPLNAVAQREFPFWRGALTPERAARAVDFLIFDFRLEHYGHSALRQFAIEHGENVAFRAKLGEEDQQSLLASWQEARTRLYRVEGWSAGFVQCVELLTDEPKKIEVWPLGEPGEPIADGAPVALRALAAAGRHVCIGRPMRFGERTVEDVAQAVRARQLDYVRRVRIVSLDDFYRLEPKALDEEAAVLARHASGIVLPGA